MTDAIDPPSVDPGFGSGGGEPYASALRDTFGILTLRECESSDGPCAGTDVTSFDVSRFHGEATATERRLLRGLEGPLIDLGCGPGRMVKAATRSGISALGVDLSPDAVDAANAAGLTVLRRSVFEALPLEGRWRSALLLDGNIGIGGDPTRMLARCAQLLGPGGVLLVETHPDADRDHAFEGTVTDGMGRTSARFAWAEIGSAALARRSAETVMLVDQSWTVDGRAFCRLVRR